MDTAQIAPEILELSIDELEAKWDRATEPFGGRVSQNLDVSVGPARVKELEQLFYAATAHARGDVEPR